jgi:hypothetical protein
MYRILISPDPDDPKRGDWPDALRIGSGVRGFALLNDVPVWKEIWRQLNGFPADFYDKYQEHSYIQDKKDKKDSDKKKKKNK